MKILEIRQLDVDYNDYVRRPAKETDYKELITESCIAIDENGQIKFIYQELGFDPTEIIQALKKIKYQETKRTAGLVTRSRIFGFMPRIPRRSDFCSATSLVRDFPREHEIITKYAEKIEHFYKENNPQGWEKHRKMTDEKIKGQYKIKGSLFTSGIINKNNQLNYHFDAGNFKDVYSCMLVFKKDVEGGFLALPEYGVGVELKNNSLFMFDGQSILHGVTPIKYQRQDGFRFSVVYYSLQQIWKCLDLSEELARVRNLKMEQARKKLDPNYREQMIKQYRKTK